MRPRSLLLALALVALATISFVPTAEAKQPKCLIVGAGGSFGTLQEAIDAASPGDTLKVKGTCFGDASISKDLTIVGQSNPGFGQATLNGANSRENRGSVIVNHGATLTIKGLTITGGYNDECPSALPPGCHRGFPEEAEKGGGIYNEGGAVTLTDSTVTGNAATPSEHNPQNNAYGGGGIYSTGSLTLVDTTVSDNEGEQYGGGIYNSGLLWLSNSTVSGNTVIDSNRGIDFGTEQYGGGIYNSGGQIWLTSSTVVRNSSGKGGRHQPGGGIYNEGGSVTLTKSTISGNKADGFEGGGGIGNRGSLTLNNSTVSDNTEAFSEKTELPCPGGGGGGISNSDSLTLNNSTLTGNTATQCGGGGIRNEGSVTLNDSTVRENTAKDGGGIYNEGGGRHGSVTFNGSSSVTGNTAAEHGGGIFNDQTHGATITFGIGWSGTVSGNKPDDIFND